MRNTPLLIGLLLFATTAAAGETPLIPPDSELETVTTGYRFTEGPALAPDTSIYFSDIPNQAIFRYDPQTGNTSLFTDQSGGANGLMFDGHTLVQCRGKDRRVYFEHIATIQEVPSKTDQTLAHEFDGQPLNSPNDLAVGNGGVYFTDPRYGNRDDMALDVEGVYYVNNGAPEERRVVRLIDDLVRPNGIGLAPDRKTLYVNDNGDKKIWAYEILEPAKLGEARLLNDLADLGGPDGMAVGPHGRIYTTIYGKGVQVLSPEGERLGFIETGPQTTNCCFGADGKTLYVTAENSLKRIRLNPDAD